MNRSQRHILATFSLLAILLRALLPTGWMPGTAADGSASFVICTTQGMMQGDRPGDAPATSDDGRQHDICPFAAAPHWSAPDTEAEIKAPSHIGVFAPARIASLRAPESAAYLPQSPRAPPTAD
jgi:hypothetical protein